MTEQTEAAAAWEALMDEVTARQPAQADYTPGNVMPPGPGPQQPHKPPGSGTEGGDPLGLQYVNLPKVAYVLMESMMSAVNRGNGADGTDLDALIELVALKAGVEFTTTDVQNALDGKNKCPDPLLIQAFADALSIDSGIILDAGQKDGCTNYGVPSPGAPPGY